MKMKPISISMQSGICVFTLQTLHSFVYNFKTFYSFFSANGENLGSNRRLNGALLGVNLTYKLESSLVGVVGETAPSFTLYCFTS